MISEQPRAEAVIDLGAVRANVARLRSLVAPAHVMVVVKADGYGHGMLQIATAARAAGATWLGVAVLEEAVRLRVGGDTGRILTWLAVPGEAYDEAVRAGIDVTASSCWQLADIVAATGRVGQVARLQLKVDTGLSRNGAPPDQWPELVQSARTAQDAGQVRLTGVWSHLACADEPGNPSVRAQEAVFRDALAAVEANGMAPGLRHLANSAGALTLRSSHFDLVRCGLASYGLSPIPQVSSAAQLGLRSAMTLRGRLAAVKRVPAGSGVSYGHTHTTPEATTLGLIPLGYADGVPRQVSNRAQVWVTGSRRPLVGSVCMDQCVVDLGDSAASPGDEVVLFGPGDSGEPTAQEWAEAADTISYEIVSRIGCRVVRRYDGGG
ncbi:MAG: alanine racemase [Nocardioidaceae bacterium]|nr:alanine racemase [Nocardioidaceae bacterium]